MAMVEDDFDDGNSENYDCYHIDTIPFPEESTHYVEDMDFCRYCHVPILREEKFCRMCGMPIYGSKKKCVNCDSELSVNDKFCSKCGVLQEAIEDDKFLTVETIEFEEIQKQFYNCSCDTISLINRFACIYGSHSRNVKVIEFYLMLLSAGKHFDRAFDIIKSFNKDILSVYLIAVDIEIEREDLSSAESFLDKAKRISPTDPLVVCRECCLSLAIYKKYNRQAFWDNAVQLSKRISQVETTDAIVKSWQLRIMSLIMQQNGEKIPCFDLDFCKKNGLKYRIVNIRDN